jgi:cellulose biosynthesis protein BcsQ
MDSLAIISGKGGSGKTTLALSLAQLLANCNKHVLLIDCDLSTHGATYFFEGELFEKDNYLTFNDVLNDNMLNEVIEKEILSVAKNINFMPSSLKFPSELYREKEIYIHNFMNFFVHKELSYDVVIFDCQAGYSLATEIITLFSKKNLAVIEADAISASSLRVLYSQLTEQLEKNKTYQVFNKISKDEEEVYSKLIFGTIFTNLTPIRFDWSVRQAFLSNELPFIDESNPFLANSVYTLAKVIFPQYRKEKMLKTTDSEIKKEEIKYVYYRRKERIKLLNYLKNIYFLCLTIMATAFTFYFFIEDNSKLNNNDYVFDIILFSILTLLMLILIYTFGMLKYKKNDFSFEEQTKKKEESKKLREELEQLKKQTENQKN